MTENPTTGWNRPRRGDPMITTCQHPRRLSRVSSYCRPGALLLTLVAGCATAAPLPRVRLATIIGDGPAVVGECDPRRGSGAQAIRHGSGTTPPVQPAPRTAQASRGSSGAQALRSFPLLEYPRPEPRGVTVLVHGLGTNARLWDLPDHRGLASALWQAGFSVYSIDTSRQRARWCPTPPAEQDAPQSLMQLSQDLSRVFEALHARYPRLPLLGVGHDLGGSALYLAASAPRSALRGVVGLGAPLSFNQPTRAFEDVVRILRSRTERPPDWGALKHLRPRDFWVALDFERALLSASLPADRRRAFFKRVSSPLVLLLVESARQPARAGADRGQRSAILSALATNKQLPVLAVIAVADGFAPPWQTDPAVLGLRRDNIKRLYLTRANGQSMEYNHLDMLLHPEAAAEVFPVIVSWLEQRLTD